MALTTIHPVEISHEITMFWWYQAAVPHRVKAIDSGISPWFLGNFDI